MDLRQLEYVVAVADSLSFTRAAEKCHVVQSALSHQIQRLETELDMRLVERTSRSVRTTSAGVSLTQLAQSGRFVEFRAGTGLRATVDGAFDAIGVQRPVILELGRISDMVRFASHGLATAIVPLTFAQDPPAGAAPYTTLGLIDDIAMSITAVRRPGTPAAALRAFRDVVDAAMASVRQRS